MELQLYQIDAFASRVFTGNPAAVCPLNQWLPDATLQAIAAENNLAETAYFVKSDGGYHIRWFTPTREVKLCGHATLASAYVLFTELGFNGDVIVFDSLSGPLKVRRKEDLWLEMDFPAQAPVPCAAPDCLIRGFATKPSACLKSEDYMLIFDSEDDVRNAVPNISELAKADLRGIIITAPGTQHDFVNRFFAPRFGINEDSVTGSAFTQLIPYWSNRLNKNAMKARQVSTRGGDVGCALQGERVFISGQAQKYMNAAVILPD